MPPPMMIAPALSTITSAVASIRKRVVSVSGMNMANTIAFHTHDHLSAASSGKSAPNVV